MYDFNYNHEESNAKDLALQYENMVANGNVVFFDQETFQNLIDYYEDQLRFQQALGVIEHAIQQHAYSAVFHIRKAQLLLEEDRLEEASEALAFAKLYEPSNLDIFLTEAEILHQEGDFEEALIVLEQSKIYADSGDYEDIYLLQSSINESDEDYQAAFKSLAEVLKINPFNEMAYSRLWLCIELMGQYAESIELHEEILDREPYAYWAWYNLGHAYNNMGLYEKAVEAYDYAIVINERFEFAYRDIIACLFRLEHYEKALRYVQDYKELFEVDADLLLWEGECYEYSGDFATARQLYVQALKKGNLEGRLHYRIGVTYANEDKWRKALQAFQTAFSQNKENEEYCIALAEVYNQLDQVEEAHTLYQRATVLSPELPISWMSYLEFLIDEQDYELAFEVLEEAERYSIFTDYNLVRIALLWFSGQRKEGQVQLIQLLTSSPKKLNRLLDIAPDLESDIQFMQIVEDCM
jgi:tetratricopeptide (TPR) repeat protein